MSDPLAGMTWERWQTLPQHERERIRDNSELTMQLVGMEGWRVEVVDNYGERRRFIVGKSTGWKPCHLELRNRRSYGGISADRSYASVRRIEKVR